MRPLAEIYAPKEFWSDEYYLNRGCGPGPFGDKFVPDKLWWHCNIQLACAIHDFMYRYGEMIEDKEKADRVFLNNMQRIIDCHGYPKLIKRMMYWSAYRYYLVVKKYGGPAFWNDKNKPEEVEVCQM